MDFIAGFIAGAATLGLWFWIIAAVAFISIMISIEWERFTVATPVAIVAIGLLMWISRFHPLEWLSANAGTLTIWIAVYLTVGIFWGVVKWFFYLMAVRDDLMAYREKEGIEKGTSLNEEQKVNFIRLNRRGLTTIPPRASESKARITFWCIYWPFSMPWTLLDEPVKRFFSFVFNRIVNLLQGMSNRLFKDIA